LDPEVINRLIEESRKRQKLAGCHGFEHTERVIELCRRLGEVLGANMDVLIPAAVLHDVSRNEENHAERGADEAVKILGTAGVDPKKIPLICEAIRAHSFSQGEKAKTIEAMILSDADKLDAMGALGIYRTALYSGEHMRPVNEFIEHFHEKLLTLKDLIYTDEARLVAEGRHKYMLEYLEEFMREMRADA
jgi:uncharacterized protein